MTRDDSRLKARGDTFIASVNGNALMDEECRRELPDQPSQQYVMVGGMNMMDMDMAANDDDDRRHSP